jgi:hypothetical protein
MFPGTACGRGNPQTPPPIDVNFKLDYQMQLFSTPRYHHVPSRLSRIIHLAPALIHGVATGSGKKMKREKACLGVPNPVAPSFGLFLRLKL